MPAFSDWATVSEGIAESVARSRLLDVARKNLGITRSLPEQAALDAAIIEAINAPGNGPPVVTDNAARDVRFPAPTGDQLVQVKATGYFNRFDQAANKFLVEGLTRSAGPVVGSGSKFAKMDGATDDSQALLDMSTAIAGGIGTGEIDVGAAAHFVNTNISLGGHIRPLRGSKLKPAAGKNIHFTGTIDKASPFAFLDLAAAGSTVTIDQNEFADLRWFSPHADGVTADDPVFNNFTGALPMGANALIPKGTYALSNPWAVSGKRGHVYDGGGYPQNIDPGAPVATLTWTGAAHGTMVNVFQSQWCKFAGLFILPGSADVVFDIDKNVGQIGTQCTFERNNIVDSTPNKPGFVGFRISNTVGSNQEYHHFIRNSVQGGQNGQDNGGGHDLSQGMAGVTVSSTLITFDAAWLALGYWVNTVTKRRIHIVGPAGQIFETRVAYASASTGTMDAAAPWTNATAQFAFNRNPSPQDQSTNDTNPLNGVDIVAGSTTVTFGADWLAVGFWNSGIVARRMRIARGGSAVAFASFALSASSATSATHSGGGNYFSLNQFAATGGASGFFMHIVSGTGAGTIREIVSNTLDTLVWGTAATIDNTSVVEVIVPVSLDVTISYLNATQGTLSAAPVFSFAGQYFVIGEGMGIALSTAASYNAKRQISQDNAAACMATGISQAGGSLHSYDDNFTIGGETCIAIGGAISEPCYIWGSNMESWRSMLTNNTFVPLGFFFGRMAQDRIAPSGPMFAYGASASNQIMIGNAIDAGPLPRGTRVHDFSQSPGVHIISIGNSFPFTDVELGYKTFRAGQVTDTAYLISLGEPSSSPQWNWAIQVLTGNRTPSAPQSAVANRIDGFLRRGIFPIDPTTAILDYSTTVEYRDTVQDIIYERTMDDLGNTGTVARPTSNAVRTGPAGRWNLDKTSMGKTHRADATVTSSIGLPNASTLSKDWWMIIERTDNTIGSALGVDGGTINGMGGFNLIGQYTKIRLTAKGDGTNTWLTEVLYLGAVKVSWVLAAIANGASQKNDFAVAGALTGCQCQVAISADQQGIIVQGFVKTSGTATLVGANMTGGSLTLGTVTAYIKVHPFVQQ